VKRDELIALRWPLPISRRGVGRYAVLADDEGGQVVVAAVVDDEHDQRLFELERARQRADLMDPVAQPEPCAKRCANLGRFNQPKRHASIRDPALPREPAAR
jgi:hypothetical protein